MKHIKPGDPELRLQTEDMSIAAINSFSIHDSHQRLAMLSLQLSQALTGDNLEEMRIGNGTSLRLSETSYDIVLKDDAIVIDVISQYSQRLDSDINERFGSKYIVLYYPNKELIDVEEIPEHELLHTDFGFKHKPTETLENLRPGDLITGGEKLTETTSRRTNNGLAIGVNVKAALVTSQDAAEDAAIINEDSLHKFQYDLYKKSTIKIKDVDMLLKLYGDKYFPDLGETVRDDGALIATRKYTEGLAMSNFDKEKLSVYDPYLDEVRFTTPGSTVVNIEIVFNSKKQIKLYKDTYEQLKKYIDQEFTYYNRVIVSYEKVKKEYPHAMLSAKYKQWIVHAKAMADRSIQKTDRRETMDTFTVIITTRKTKVPNVSQKFTGMDGDKVICSAIVPSSQMPRDKDGNVADILIEMNSTFSRINDGRLYRGYIGMSAIKCEKIIKDELDNILKQKKKKASTHLEGLYLLNKKELLSLYDILLEYISLFGTKQYTLYKNLRDDYDAVLDIMKEVVGERLYIMINAVPDKDNLQTVLDIDNSRFRPTKDKLLIYENGEYVETKNDIMLQELYIVLLNKTGKQWMAAPTPYLNPRQSPAKPSNNVKPRLPWTNTPVSALGATEVRLYGAFSQDERAIAELMDRAKNPDTMRAIFRNILKAKNPMKIKRVVDRDEIPYGENPTLKLIENILKVGGRELDYIPEELAGDNNG